MANFTVKDPPEYNDEMRMLEPTDPAHANLLNPMVEQLLNNDNFLKAITDLAEQHMKNGEIHVTAQDKADWDAKAGTAAATQGAAGLMSAADKVKLDNVAAGAEVNQNAYSNVKVGNITITANSKTATFTLEAGSNITLAADNAAKKITITANRDGGNADTVDGYHAAHFAAADHGHDGRYNTKAEITTLLSQKAASSHGHTRASITDFPTSMPPTAHAHDDRYYTEAEVRNLLADKAASSHSHSNYAAKSIYGNTVVSMGRKSGTTDGTGSFAFGLSVEASGEYSHVEGSGSKASGLYSHAERQSKASAQSSHSEGSGSAEASFSHAEGNDTKSTGDYSHAEGRGTIASNYASHAGGKYNVLMTNGGDWDNKNGHVFVVGNGSGDTSRSNALSLMYSGILKTAGTITASTAADYAEFFEWQDGNPDAEDRVGRFVTLDGDKIRIADAGDTYILGIVSGRPFVLGNGDCDTWTGMYLHDSFNREVMEPAPKVEMVEITEEVEREVQEIDEETGEMGTTIVKETIVTGHEEREVLDVDGNPVYEGERPKINPDYDHTQKYISRFDRPEWAAVGMLGVLAVYDDGSCQVNGYCKVATGGIATAAQGEYMLAGGKILRGYRVIGRVANDIVKVVFR